MAVTSYSCAAAALLAATVASAPNANAQLVRQLTNRTVLGVTPGSTLPPSITALSGGQYAIGAPGAPPAGAPVFGPARGQVQIIQPGMGLITNPTTIQGNVNSDCSVPSFIASEELGGLVTNLGDIDGDGQDDLGVVCGSQQTGPSSCIQSGVPTVTVILSRNSTRLTDLIAGSSTFAANDSITGMCGLDFSGTLLVVVAVNNGSAGRLVILQPVPLTTGGTGLATAGITNLPGTVAGIARAGDWDADLIEDFALSVGGAVSVFSGAGVFGPGSALPVVAPIASGTVVTSTSNVMGPRTVACAEVTVPETVSILAPGAPGLAVVMSPIPGNGFGSSLAFGGDVDGDGAEDLAIGAPLAATGGAVFLSDLSATLQPNPITPVAGGTFGTQVAIVGDQNGDAFDDVVILDAGNANVTSFFGGPVASIAVFGAGCSSLSAGAPTLGVNQLPVLGAAGGLVLTHAGFAAPAPGITFFGNFLWGTGALPVPVPLPGFTPGCNLLIDLSAGLLPFAPNPGPGPGPGGLMTVTLPSPTDPVFLGATFSFQGVVIGTTATSTVPSGIEVSNGLSLTFGW